MNDNKENHATLSSYLPRNPEMRSDVNCHLLDVTWPLCYEPTAVVTAYVKPSHFQQHVGRHMRVYASLVELLAIKGGEVIFLQGV